MLNTVLSLTVTSDNAQAGNPRWTVVLYLGEKSTQLQHIQIRWKQQLHT